MFVRMLVGFLCGLPKRHMSKSIRNAPERDKSSAIGGYPQMREDSGFSRDQKHSTARRLANDPAGKQSEIDEVGFASPRPGGFFAN